MKLHLRGKVQPSPETTREYGEHLRHLGMPLCSGLWMLWATGRHSDVVGTVVTWLRNRPANTFELVDNVWHAVALASRLASPTGLDRHLDFLQRHIRNAVLTPETYEVLWSWARDMVMQVQWLSISRSYHAYLDRKIAKTPWLTLVPLATEMQTAFDRWLTAGRSASLTRPLDRLAQATLAMAESDLLLADRETAIFGPDGPVAHGHRAADRGAAVCSAVLISLRCSLP